MRLGGGAGGSGHAAGRPACCLSQPSQPCCSFRCAGAAAATAAATAAGPRCMHGACRKARTTQRQPAPSAGARGAAAWGSGSIVCRASPPGAGAGASGGSGAQQPKDSREDIIRALGGTPPSERPEQGQAAEQPYEDWTWEADAELDQIEGDAGAGAGTGAAAQRGASGSGKQTSASAQGGQAAPQAPQDVEAVQAAAAVQRALAPGGRLPGRYVGPLRAELIKGRGWGLVAEVDLQPGQLLLVCEPAAFVPGAGPGHTPQLEDVAAAVAAASEGGGRAAGAGAERVRRAMAALYRGQDREAEGLVPSLDTWQLVQPLSRARARASASSASSSSSSSAAGGDAAGAEGGPAPPGAGRKRRVMRASDVVRASRMAQAGLISDAALQREIAAAMGAGPQPQQAQQPSLRGAAGGGQGGSGSSSPHASLTPNERLAMHCALLGPGPDLSAAAIRGDPLDGFAGVWPEAALLNHDCAPSATWLLLGDRLVVRAARAVAAGGEVTLNWLSSGASLLAPRAARSAELASRLGCRCRCARCTAEIREDLALRYVLGDALALAERAQEQQLPALVGRRDLQGIAALQERLSRELEKLQAAVLELVGPSLARDREAETAATQAKMVAGGPAGGPTAEAASPLAVAAGGWGLYEAVCAAQTAAYQQALAGQGASSPAQGRDAAALVVERLQRVAAAQGAEAGADGAVAGAADGSSGGDGEYSPAVQAMAAAVRELAAEGSVKLAGGPLAALQLREVAEAVVRGRLMALEVLTEALPGSEEGASMAVGCLAFAKEALGTGHELTSVAEMAAFEALRLRYGPLSRDMFVRLCAAGPEGDQRWEAALQAQEVAGAAAAERAAREREEAARRQKEEEAARAQARLATDRAAEEAAKAAAAAAAARRAAAPSSSPASVAAGADGTGAAGGASALQSFQALFSPPVSAAGIPQLDLDDDEEEEEEREQLEGRGDGARGGQGAAAAPAGREGKAPARRRPAKRAPGGGEAEGPVLNVFSDILLPPPSGGGGGAGAAGGGKAPAGGGKAGHGRGER